MGIPIGNTYTSTLTGKVAKHVCCEQCQAEFVYLMEREAIGESTSWLFLDNAGAQGTAADEAAHELAEKLSKECDPIPCPTCGAYQEDMRIVLKSQHRQWMFYLGIFLMVVCFFAVLVTVSNSMSVYRRNSIVFWPALVAGTSAAAGLTLIFVRRILAAKYDPNSDPLEQRQQIAKEKAITRDEFERLVAENEQPAVARNTDPRWSFLEE